jgi:hypothetical protein
MITLLCWRIGRLVGYCCWHSSNEVRGVLFMNNLVNIVADGHGREVAW